MDPRGSTARLLSDPRGAAEELAGQARIEIGHVVEARHHTAREVERLRSAFARDRIDDDISIVVFGSWAREELTEGSDDDFAVLVDRPIAAQDAAVTSALAAARRELGTGGRQPGSQDVFGVAFEVEPVVRNIGLDADSNTNLTRRMLLVLESHELTGEVRRQAWDQILERYLSRAPRPRRPPRFLLNDLVRYWRTIGVDFEGKHPDASGSDPKRVTRNAKLRTSRKLLFAGGLLPVLMCHELTRAEMEQFLGTWLAAPPLDRLAAAFLHLGAPDEGARALRAYDRWIAIQQDPEARAELKRLTAATRDASRVFNEVREIGKRFEDALLALLYDTPLSPVSRRYLVF